MKVAEGRSDARTPRKWANSEKFFDPNWRRGLLTRAAKRFELPLYVGTAAAPVVFDKPGVVGLVDVYFLTTPLFAKTGADGRAHLPNLATGAYEARVWHPRQREETEKTGQKLTLGPANTQVGFTIRLKREWRIPRRESPRYGEDR